MKFVTDCNADLIDKIKTVATLQKQAISVYSMDDLVAQMSNVVKPAAGVMYEGARSVSPEGGKQANSTAEIVFSLFLLTEYSSFSKQVDVRTPAHEVLDGLREAIHGTRSPTGHFWKWQLEAPVKPNGKFAIWLQRWSCVVQLTPGTK
jgi:hypothetical protein